MSKLNNKDYLAIINYYGIDTKGLKANDRKNIALDVLANKLCKCIKKISPKRKGQAISICKNSIFTKKKLTVGRFNCKKKAAFIPNKINGQTLLKIASRTRKKRSSRKSL